MFCFLHKEMHAVVIGFSLRQLSQQEVRLPIEIFIFAISFSEFQAVGIHRKKEGAN